MQTTDQHLAEFHVSHEEWLRLLDTADRLLNVVGALNDELAEARLKINRLEKAFDTLSATFAEQNRLSVIAFKNLDARFTLLKNRFDN
jgi:hypothetical protein